jgi:glucokinase
MSGVETIGIDLGGTKLLLGVLDGAAEVGFTSTETSTGMGTEQVLSAIDGEIRKAVAARPQIAAVGLGIPCTIDRERGLAISAVNLQIDNVPIRDEIQERVGLPVFIDNDANMAMLGEHLFGAARGARNAVMLTIGTGVGGGLLLEGRIYRGSTGAGAELGHMVIDMHGPRCQGNCPGHGCLEAVASGTALAREGRIAAQSNPASALGRLAAAGREIDGPAITDAALGGDSVARKVIEMIGSRIGAGLSGLANIFEPDVMVVGGGVIGAGELLLEPARQEVRSRALPPMNEIPVAAAELGPRAGMFGAAAMARLELEAAA